MEGLINQELIELCQRHLATAIKRYRTEALAEIETNINTLLLQYKDHVVYRSWLAAQKWCRWQNDKFILFPDYTRIYYRKGEREVLVQEYPPQVRVMSFKDRLVTCGDSDEAMQYDGEYEGTKTYSLALPYVIFIFLFDGGHFSEVYVGFSDRPLKDCNETLFRPYLPNLDSNLKLCLGTGIDIKSDKFIKGNVSQQAAYILNHFWQTTYTDEWSSHYWVNKSHFSEIDPRLASLPAWQDASIEDSLFVIDNVEWLPLTADWSQMKDVKVGDMIARLLEGSVVDAEFGIEVYKQIHELFQDQIKSVIMGQLDAQAEKMPITLANNLATDLTNFKWGD